MSNPAVSNKRLSSQLEIDYPDFSKLPEPVKQKYESLPTVVNIFRMLGYSSGTFVEIINLTNAIFNYPPTTKSFLFCRWLRMKAMSMNGSNMFPFLKRQAFAQINSLPLLNNALMTVKHLCCVN